MRICDTKAYYFLFDRNPEPKSRPTFRQLLLSLLGNDESLLMIPEEEKATHTLAAVLGSPLEAGYHMYLDDQQRYRTLDEMQLTEL